MKQPTVSVLLMVCILGLLSAGCEAPPEKVDHTPQPAILDGALIEKELLAADTAFGADVAKRGIEGWMTHFAEDAVRMRFRGEITRGLDEIRAADSALFAEGAPRLTWQPADAEVFGGGELGFTRGRYRLENMTETGPGEVMAEGTYFTLWRKDDGVWKVILDTGVADEPAEPAEKTIPGE